MRRRFGRRGRRRRSFGRRRRSFGRRRMSRPLRVGFRM